MRPYMRAANVKWTGIDLTDVKEMDFTREEVEVFGLHRGDVLVSEASGSRREVGKSAVWNDEVPGACFQNTLIRVRTDARILPDYLQRHLLYDARRGALAEVSKGVGIHHLSAKGVAEWSVALAPLNEQLRIVRKIDALTEKSREARQALAEVPALLDQLRQSILAAAFRGELTKEWRTQNPDVEPASKLLERIRRERRQRWEEAELAKMRARGKEPKDDKWKQKYKEPAPVDLDGLPELPEGWCWASLGELTINYDGVRVPVRRADRAARVGQYDYYGASGVIDKIDDYLFDGTYLLIAEDGANLLSRSTPIAFIARGKFWVNNHAHVVQTSVVPETYLMHCLNGRDLSPWVSGSAQPKLNQKNMDQIPVALAPLAEVSMLLRAVEGLNFLVEQLESVLVGHEDALATLDSAILARAFRGELVPQDPADEPASVLLERIRAEREAANHPSSRVRAKKTAKKARKSA